MFTGTLEACTDIRVDNTGNQEELCGMGIAWVTSRPGIIYSLLPLELRCTILVDHAMFRREIVPVNSTLKDWVIPFRGMDHPGNQ